MRVNECVFVIDSVLKTTKPGKHLTNIGIRHWSTTRICLDKTSTIRGLYTQLLLSYQKPHRPVSTGTIGRCIKVVLTQAGINTTAFSAHSTRTAQPLQLIVKESA